MPNIPLSADRMFANFLYRAELNKKKMPKIQHDMMQEAFYGALANLLLILGTEDAVPDEILGDYLTTLEKEVVVFWDKKIK